MQKNSCTNLEMETHLSLSCDVANNELAGWLFTVTMSFWFPHNARTIVDVCWPMKRSKYSDSDGLFHHNLLAPFSMTCYPH